MNSKTLRTALSNKKLVNEAAKDARTLAAEAAEDARAVRRSQDRQLVVDLAEKKGIISEPED